MLPPEPPTLVLSGQSVSQLDPKIYPDPCDPPGIYAQPADLQSTDSGAPADQSCRLVGFAANVVYTLLPDEAGGDSRGCTLSGPPCPPPRTPSAPRSGPLHELCIVES